MKKFTLFTLISLFSIINCFAQDKGYIAVSLGPSIPTGDFASKNPNYQPAGLANPGAIFDISFGYKFDKNFGIAALIRGQANTIDGQVLAQELLRQNPGLSYTVDGGTWAIAGYMFGGYGSFPISEKISFESRIMFGFLTATSPDINVDAFTSGYSGWVKQSGTRSTAFAHLIGVGFKWDVGRRIALLANFDYLGAKPEFRNVITTSSAGTMEMNTFSQRFGTINFGIGVGYRL